MRVACEEELYVSFNDVSDLSPLLSHEALRPPLLGCKGTQTGIFVGLVSSGAANLGYGGQLGG